MFHFLARAFRCLTTLGRRLLAAERRSQASTKRDARLCLAFCSRQVHLSLVPVING